jgi:glycosyltransferase involved in cell wall biosynthesis
LLQDLIARDRIAAESAVYFVDDGSRDKTWSVIESLSGVHPFVRGIKLSRNRGHQNALLAGLFSAEGDAVISFDADLQDDLGAIESMVDAYASGSEIVYGVRKGRAADTMFKRFTALGYYKLLRIMGVDAVFNHADYRLMSRRAIDTLAAYKEVNLFLRGIIPQLGFSTSSVFYDRAERFAGESKYPLRKMLAFAWQGITSFSAVAATPITVLGVLMSFGSFAVALWALWDKLFSTGRSSGLGVRPCYPLTPSGDPTPVLGHHRRVSSSKIISRRKNGSLPDRETAGRDQGSPRSSP